MAGSPGKPSADQAAWAGLSDEELLARCRVPPAGSAERAAACEVLVRRYKPLVRACVRPYLDSPEPAEDLMQVGYVGLLKAINNFDPELGAGLSPTRCRASRARSSGTSAISAGRCGDPAAAGAAAGGRAGAEVLTAELGRDPSGRSCRALRVTEDELLEAHHAAWCSPSCPWMPRPRTR